MNRIFTKQNSTISLVPIVSISIIILIGNIYGNDAENIPIIGISLSLLASISEVTVISVLALSAAITTIIFVLRSFIYYYNRRWRKTVGYGGFREDRLNLLSPALLGQASVLSGLTTWPSHEAKAGIAKSAADVQFGDAQYTTPQAALEALRKFIGAPEKKDRCSSLEHSVFTITGEPGAGKSILTQEIHQSLAQGIIHQHHSLVPVVIFAADFTLKSVNSKDSRPPDLKTLLVSYFHDQVHPGCREMENFISLHWSDCDFLIIIDGLDEIAQRSSYFEIQDILKGIIQRELNQSGGRVRRFLMSCRINDEVGLYRGCPTVNLKGLASEAQRIKFCRRIADSAGLVEAQKVQLFDVLRENSRYLNSSDIFRRNPYFLSLLIEYFKNRKSKGVGAQLDFDYLMGQYIEREAERSYSKRPNATQSGQAEAPSKFRRALEPSARIALQFFSYHMTRSRNEDALYNRTHLNGSVIDAFIQEGLRGASEGVWLEARRLLESLCEDVSDNEEGVQSIISNDILDENDIRILMVLAQRPDWGKEALVRYALGKIDTDVRGEEGEWYDDFVKAISLIAEPAFKRSMFDRLAALLFIRGFAAAHALRLMYVTLDAQEISAQFRHRRLAEYFAACYYVVRWSDSAEFDGSPWLTPVLNLVAAIEGPPCRAMHWFTHRVGNYEKGDAINWRTRVLDAAEVTAFAHRGEKFNELLASLTKLLIDGLQQLRQKGKAQSSDIVSEIAAVNAMAFIGSLGTDQISISAEHCQAFFQGQAELDSTFSMQAAKASSGLAKLTGHRPNLRSQIQSLFKLIAFPVPVLGRWYEASDSIPIWKLAILLITMFISEILVVILSSIIMSYLIMLGMPGSLGWTQNQVFWPTLSTIGVIWSIARTAMWATSPTKAYYWIAPIQFIYSCIFLILGYGAYFLVVAWRSLPDAFAFVRDILHNFFVGIPEFIRWIWSLTRFWREAVLTVSIVSAVAGLLWLGTSFVLASLASASPDGIGGNVAQSPNGRSRTKTSVEPQSAAKRATSSERASIQTVTRSKKIEDDVARGPCADLSRAKSRLERIPFELQVSPQKLVSLREEVTSLASVFGDQLAVGQCSVLSDFAEGGVPGVIASVLARDDRLIPIIDEGETIDFGPDDFARYRQLVTRNIVALPEEDFFSGFNDGDIVDSIDQRHDALALFRLKMLSGRNSGSISSSLNFAQPSGQAFSDMVEEISQLEKKYSAMESTLQMQMRELHNRWKRAMFRAFVMLLFVVGAGWALGAVLIYRRDNRIIAEARTWNFEKLLGQLTTQRWSERAREGVSAHLSDLNLSKDELARLNEAACSYADKGGSLNKQFSLQLGRQVQEMYRRKG